MLQDYILRDNGIHGKDSDFDQALDGLNGTIPEVQNILVSVSFSKSVHDMEVKFDMITRQKTIFCSLQVAQV